MRSVQDFFGLRAAEVAAIGGGIGLFGARGVASTSGERDEVLIALIFGSTLSFGTGGVVVGDGLALDNFTGDRRFEGVSRLK